MIVQRIRQIARRWRARAGDLKRARHAADEWKQRRREADVRIEALEQRLVARDRDIEGLKAKLDAAIQRRDAALEKRRVAEDTCTQLSGRLDVLRTRDRDAHAELERLHRAIPSSDTVRRTFELRRPVALARARGPEAVAREAQFRERSAAYVAAVPAAAAATDGAPDMARTTLQGLTWWVPVLKPGDELPGSPWLAKQRFPYRTIAQTRELAVGGIMLDLGCNLGRMAISRAVLGDVMAVYGAEPDPLNYACLVRNVVANGLAGLVMPDHCAIGDRDGTARLKRAGSSGGHHVERDGGSDLTEVPMYTLDSWVRRLGIDLDLVTFVKVDVQGYEPYVLAGAAATLAHRHVVWQMEISPSLLRQAGTEPADLYARLSSHFSHFTDLNKNASGGRGRPTRELADALGYIEGGHHDQTDLVLFNQAEVVS